VAALAVTARALSGGHLVYALDDAYIHMAVAKNLADHGVWGVTRYEFTSATSSIGWPLLLAAARAVGLSLDLAPLLFNAAFGVLALVVAGRALSGEPARVRLPALVAVALLTPMPTLALGGMEHTGHVAAVLALAAVVDRALQGEERPGLLGALGAVATAARYESLFVVAAAAVTFAVVRRRRAAVALVVGALVPVSSYAAYSIAQGWPALPNSLLLKGAAAPVPGGVLGELLGGRLARALAEAPHLLGLVMLVALAAAWSARPAARPLGAIFVAAALLHLELASVGWLYRYEAYLVAWGLVLLAQLVATPGGSLWTSTPRPARTLVAVALGLASAPLVARGVQAVAETPRACRNIYEQQYQMGLFLARHYRGATVMANDVGAVSYLADIHLVDLYGLATRETSAARRAGRLDRPFLADLSARMRPEVVVVYRSWFADAIPTSWIEVGTWRAPEKVVVADRTVSFLAPDEPAARRLRDALASFQAELPPRVVARSAGP
jgi:hypothetical protein